MHGCVTAYSVCSTSKAARHAPRALAHRKRNKQLRPGVSGLVRSAAAAAAALCAAEAATVNPESPETHLLTLRVHRQKAAGHSAVSEHAPGRWRGGRGCGRRGGGGGRRRRGRGGRRGRVRGGHAGGHRRVLAQERAADVLAVHLGRAALLANRLPAIVCARVSALLTSSVWTMSHCMERCYTRAVQLAGHCIRPSFAHALTLAASELGAVPLGLNVTQHFNKSSCRRG